MTILQNTVLAILAVITFQFGDVSANNATWLTNPTNGDWNNANNWSAGGPPNGPNEVASFDTSNVTTLSFSGDIQLSGIKFLSNAPAYTITVPQARLLTIFGEGSLNASFTPQNFLALAGDVSTPQIRFVNNASAGVNTIFTAEGGATGSIFGAAISFEGNSNADHASFVINGSQGTGFIGGQLYFGLFGSNSNSTAGHAVVINHGGGQSGGGTLFSNGSTAGNGVFINEGGRTAGAIFGAGSTGFINGATAENGTFINEGGTTNQASGGSTGFDQNARAGNGTFVASGGMVAGAGGARIKFADFGSADHGNFTLNGATVAGAGGTQLIFEGHSTAANGTFVANGPAIDQGGFGYIQFLDNSTAASGMFTLNGGPASGEGPLIEISAATSAGNATFIVNGGLGSFGQVLVFGSAGNATFVANGNSGEFGGNIDFLSNSTGGTARIALDGTGRLETLQHDSSGLTIGSLEGNGLVFIGSHKLSLGSINASTSFSGTIQENMVGGGSLGKIGAGTLVLGGANTYTGPTTVSAGKLAVNGSIASAVTASGGTVSGTGLINAAVTVNTGAALLGGDAVTPTGSLTIANNLTLNMGSLIELVFGPSGMHSSLVRTGGTWSFAPNQRFTFLDVGAQPGFYDNIITGLTRDPGATATWTITNVGFTGTFSYDGAGNIDLTLTSAMGPALQMMEAVSRKTHGAAGDFDIPLPLTGQPGVECRSSNGNHTLVFTFNNNVVGGNASVMNGIASITSNPVFSNNTMTVNLTDVADVQTIAVMLSSVTDSFGQVLPDKSISMTILVGDTNGNGTVNASDIGQTKGQVGVPVSSSNYRTDINGSGAITSSDVSLVKANIGHGLAIARTAGH